MGWYWGAKSRRSLIEEFKNVGDKWKEVAGCYRGSAWKGKYWQVLEHEVTGRIIVLYLMEYDRHEAEWGYKDMQESMHPYYYDCPLSYLDMVPVACEKWRDGVRGYAALASARRKASLARTRARKAA